MSEEVIQSDYDACDELLRVGGSRNTFIEANCERIETWREFADLGDPRGQVLYGLCFFYGQGVEEDYEKAVKWYTKSAEQGNALGQQCLGVCYYYGRGVEQDDQQAFEWYTKAAKQGESFAQFNLGYCNEFGRGVNQDERKAVDWYIKSAKQGNALGQYCLGNCFGSGYGVKQDYKKAVEWLTKSAEQGNANGQFFLGQCFHNGHGVEQDDKQAFEWYTKSAEQGNEPALKCLRNGWIQSPKSIAQSDVEFLKGLAADGCKDALKTLGCLHFMGIGVTKNVEEGKELIRQGDGIITLEVAVDAMLDKDSVDLGSFLLLDVDSRTAAVLTRVHGNLNLRGLIHISAEAADRLRGIPLYLNNLTSVSDEVAKILGTVQYLTLGLPTLSDKQALLLTNNYYENPLDNITDRYENDSSPVGFRSFPDLKDLEADVAKNLVISVERLVLSGLTSVSDEVAEILSKHTGRLSLTGLTSLSEVAARYMVGGGMSWLELGFQEFPESMVTALTPPQLENPLDDIRDRFVGDAPTLSFPRITNLTPDAAIEFTRHYCNLSFLGVTALSEEVAEIVCQHRGLLSLPNLEELSDIAAERLSSMNPLGLKLNLDNLPESAATILRDAGHT